MIRAQYHFRKTEAGLLVWDVRRLVELSRNLPVREVRVSEISEMDETHWYSDGDPPTCRSIAEHCALIHEADLSYPIILDQNGRVMDGMHRVCRASMDGVAVISAVRFEEDPEPDYVDPDLETLPYD